MRALALSVAIALTGCSYTIEQPATYASEGVARLYDYPANKEYESLGIHAWGFYSPGMSDPSVSRVWPDLSEKVTTLGGNACIVKHDEVVGMLARTIEVTCEVLKVQ